MKVYKSMIRPILEYGSFVYGSAPAWVCPKIQVLQNNATRIAKKINDPRGIDVDILHRDFDLEKMVERRDRQLLSIIYSRAQERVNVKEPVRQLRGNVKVQLVLPIRMTELYMKSPLYRGVQLWNKLSHSIQHSPSKVIFMQRLIMGEHAEAANDSSSDESTESEPENDDN